MNQENTPLLSIIVPMYNVAPYVERCLRSLADQNVSTEDYEIICVNDGSPDNCQEIVESLQEEIPNIILINQENQGVSMARNNALAIAKGKYMMPIDPDDYVVPNCLAGVLRQAEENNLDILYAAFEIFDVNHNSIWRTDYSHLRCRIDNGYDGYFAVRGPKVKDPDRSWAMLYTMDLLRKYDVHYPKDVPFLEDGLFLGKVFAVADQVGYSDDDFYQRTTRPGSATHSDLFYQKKSINGFKLALKEIRNFRARLPENMFSSELLNHVGIKFLILCLTPSIIKRERDVYTQLNLELGRTTQNEYSIKGVRGIYKRLFRIYCMSPLLLYYIYPFYKRVEILIHK